MKKFIAPLVLALVASFGFYACLTSGGSSGSTSLSWEWDVVVTKLTATTIATRSVEYGCQNTTVVADTTRDTSNYVFTGGKLYVWDPKACGAEAYSGTSTNTSTPIIGSWTLDAFTNVAIPASSRPPGCTATVSTEDTSGIGALGDIFQNASASFTVTATNLHSKISGDLCFGTVLADAYGSDTTYLKVTSSDCQSVNLKSVQTNKTATMTISFADNKMTTTFKSGGKTCSTSIPFASPGTMPNCAANTSAADSAYSACLVASGFYGTMAKASSSQTRRLNPDLAGVTR